MQRLPLDTFRREQFLTSKLSHATWRV